VAVAFLFGEELVERGEDHAASRHAEQLPQVHTVGLDGRLPQQVAATRKGGEKLVVEVVAAVTRHMT
jgi:hypothetical protein